MNEPTSTAERHLSGRTIADVARIDAPRNRPIHSDADLEAVVEEPLRPIVKDLLGKNIPAFETSANMERGDMAWVDMYADVLSRENWDILFNLEMKIQYEDDDAPKGVWIEDKELREERGRPYWSIQTDMDPNEPIELVTARIAQVTDRLMPQPV